MEEVAHACKDHGDSKPVCSSNDFAVPNWSAWRNYI